MNDLLTRHKEIVFLDTETTGFSPERNQIIEFAAIRAAIRDGQIAEELSRIDLYIQPDHPVSDRIARLTGITNEQLKSQPYESERFHEIRQFLSGTSLYCAYNAAFDRNFITAMFRRYGFHLDPVCNEDNWIDALAVARKRIPRDKIASHTLSQIASYLGMDKGLTYHCALDDTKALARIMCCFSKPEKTEERQR